MLLRCCLFLSLAAAGAVAQTFGEITGTVTDSSGAVVEGAAIAVTNTATGQVREVQTNATGNYTLPFLVPGVYTARAAAASFKAATRRIELQVGAVARVNFTLELGMVTETVEVSGGAPLLVTENAAVGTVIENRRIVELPLNGRNYLQMIALSPNVAAEQRAGGEAAARKGGERSELSYAIAGQRAQFNHFTLDGVENTDVSYNIFALRPSIDALQEFKVETGVYSAEFGRMPSQINVATKSGTNELHGALFEFHRNENMDAREWLKTGAKNPFVRNQYGFVVGGRILRDRLFYMANFESLRENKTLQTSANVAPDRMRAGDFTASGRQVYDHLTRTYQTDARGNQIAVSAMPFPNQVIPRNRFHPLSVRLLEFYPESQRRDDVIVRNFVKDVARPITWEQFIQRMDFVENAKSSWFGRFSWGDEDSKEIGPFFEQTANILTRTYQGVLSNTRAFSPSLVNEFRFGYTQFQNDQLRPHAFKRDVTGELRIVGLPSPVEASYGTPSIGLGLGLSGFGEQVNGPFVQRSHVFQLFDTFAWTRGRHTWKFGGEIRRDRFNETGNAFTRGSFAFEDKASQDPARRGTTGHHFADYLLGEVRAAQRARTFSNGLFRATAIVLFFDDTWRVTPKVTVNAGLRYERVPPYHDKYRGMMNIKVYDAGATTAGLNAQTRVPLMVRPGTGDFHEGLPFHFHDGIPKATGDDVLGRPLVATDSNDLAPRLGIAYRPTDKWVIRAGIGAFFIQDIAEVRFDLTRNIGGRSNFIADEERPNAPLNDPWRDELVGTQCSNWSGQCQGPAFMLMNNPDRRTPYLLQWLFNVQRQIGQDANVEVGYMGSQGHKLEDLRVWNQPVERTGPTDARTLAQRSPWPAYGLIQAVDGFVNSNYHGLSFKARQRFSKGLTYLVGFTWSKSIDQGSAIRNNTGDNQFPITNYDVSRDRALSQFHVGRRFVSSLLYELPFGAGRKLASSSRVVNTIIGGWQLGSIVTFADGTPIIVGGLGDRLNISVTNYPDATGISPIPSNRSDSNFWNIAAFNTTNPELSFRFGNVGRNTLTVPGLRQWDFSLIKDTKIRERHTIQFRFEAFNFANHPNWNIPGTAPTATATFGRVTSARTMRELQFGLKYLF
jgi:hypothetical protein